MSQEEHWDTYYRKEQEIPWGNSKMAFLGSVWYWFNLPRTGILLDVGCGQGDKSVFLAQVGFEVWAFDIATSAIVAAKEKSSNYAHQPYFFVGDASHLDQIPDISNNTYDVVLDLFSTQFLSREQRMAYLNHLQPSLKQNDTYYIFQCFALDETVTSQPEEGLKKIGLSLDMVEKSYGVYFKILYNERAKDKLGRAFDTYVLQAK